MTFSVSVSDLFQGADKAMYQAKMVGRNTYRSAAASAAASAAVQQ